MAGCGVGFGYGYLLLEDLERLEVIAHDAQLFLELDHLTASRALRATCANTSMRLLALPCLALPPNRLTITPLNSSSELAFTCVLQCTCSSPHLQLAQQNGTGEANYEQRLSMSTSTSTTSGRDALAVSREWG